MKKDEKFPTQVYWDETLWDVDHVLLPNNHDIWLLLKLTHKDLEHEDGTLAVSYATVDVASDVVVPVTPHTKRLLKKLKTSDAMRKSVVRQLDGVWLKFAESARKITGRLQR